MRTIRKIEMRIRRVPLAEEEKVPYGEAIHEPNHLARIAKCLIGDAAQELFIVIFLDVKNRVLGYSEIGRGSIDMCPVDPKMAFRNAVAVGATALAIAHNHPSGDTQPSREDRDLTTRFRRGADLLGFTLLDHVIVTDETVFSFAEHGLLA